MNITVDHVQGRVPVAVLAVRGDLDASNYEALIAQARQVFGAGTGDILLDLSGTTFVSSSGLVALHSIAMLLQGKQPPGAEDGWAAIHAVGRDLGSGVAAAPQAAQTPSPRWSACWNMAGLKELFEMTTWSFATVAARVSLWLAGAHVPA